MSRPIEYKIFAALKEDINAPFVWISSPNVKLRSIIKLTNPDTNKSVYCEALKIDNNFIEQYNSRHSSQCSKKTISDDNSTLVINEWYRNKISVKTGDSVALDIKSHSSYGLLYQILAGWAHPDSCVRLCFILAVVSVIFGVIGFFLGLIGIFLGF